jgi:hypothetical protein
MSDGRMIDHERATSWSKRASTDYRVGVVVCKLERAAIVMTTDRELTRSSIKRQSRMVVWKSCVMVDGLME